MAWLHTASFLLGTLLGLAVGIVGTLLYKLEKKSELHDRILLMANKLINHEDVPLSGDKQGGQDIGDLKDLLEKLHEEIKNFYKAGM